MKIAYFIKTSTHLQKKEITYRKGYDKVASDYNVTGKLTDLKEKVNGIVEQISNESSSKLTSAWLQAATIIVQKV